MADGSNVGPKSALLIGIDEYSGPGLADLHGSLFDECLGFARRDGKLNHLRDVEIAFLLDQIADKGATVTFMLDCCH